jgi:hypothetical protein
MRPLDAVLTRSQISFLHVFAGGEIDQGQSEIDQITSGASLLNNAARQCMLRACRGTPRKGPMQISGAYPRALLEKAFDAFGEWHDYLGKANYVTREIVVRDQETMSRATAFQVPTASSNFNAANARDGLH